MTEERIRIRIMTVDNPLRLSAFVPRSPEGYVRGGSMMPGAVVKRRADSDEAPAWQGATREHARRIP